MDKNTDAIAKIVNVIDERPIASLCLIAFLGGAGVGFGTGYYKGRKDSDEQQKNTQG